MRIDPNITPTILADLQQSQTTLNTSLQEVSTGLSVNQPSDNPTAAATMVEDDMEIGDLDEYTQNTSTALATVKSATSVLSSVVTSLTSAESAGIEGANGTSSADTMNVLATQVQGILSSIISAANTSVSGVYLFGGTSSATPYTADSASATGYTYNGNDVSSSVAVGDGTTVNTNLPGSAVFSNSTTNVIGSLTSLVNALKSGSSAAVETAVTGVNSAISFVGQQQVFYSNAETQLSNQDTFLQTDTLDLSTQATALVGISESTAATNLSQAETDNSAALAAVAKVMPTNILEYLEPPS